MNIRGRPAVIAALGLHQIFSWGSSYYLLAVIAAPVAEETGWPLTWIVGSLSAGLLVAGLVSPRVGLLIGLHGGRPVLAASVLLLAFGLVVLALAPNLGVLAIGWLLLGLGMGAGLYDAAFATLGRIYGADARGAITSLTLWGGFASTICWPLSAYLVQTFGWRGTCLGYAAIHLGLSLPLIVFVVPRQAVATESRQVSSGDTDLSPAERRVFRLLAGVMVIGGTLAAAISVHLLTLLQDRGLALGAAVALGALIGPAQVGARIVEMAFKARHHPIWTLMAAVLLMAAGLLLLWTEIPVLALPLLLYGAGNGVYSIARGTLPLALFGPQRYPALIGRLARPSLIAGALAPSLAAVILSQAGSGATLAALAGLGLVNVCLVAIIWRALGGAPGLAA